MTIEEFKIFANYRKASTCDDCKYFSGSVKGVVGFKCEKVPEPKTCFVYTTEVCDLFEDMFDEGEGEV